MLFITALISFVINVLFDSDENKEDVPLGKALLGTVIQVIGRNKQVLESGDGELFTGKNVLNFSSVDC